MEKMDGEAREIQRRAYIQLGRAAEMVVDWVIIRGDVSCFI